jgi:hypothetical protein
MPPSREEREEELRARTPGGLDGGGYITGGALPGGPIPTDSHGHKPLPTIRVPSKNPIGGPQKVTATPGVLAQLGYLTTPDNVPRKMTLLVTQNQPIVNQAGAVASGGLGV